MKCVTGKDGFLAINSLLATSVLFSHLAMFKSRISGTLRRAGLDQFHALPPALVEQLQAIGLDLEDSRFRQVRESLIPVPSGPIERGR
jgi:hypothetical protein